ncbi:MAG: pyridoxamine 5'-phosphate oxidase family protein [Desulfomonilaceae bacterium]
MEKAEIWPYSQHCGYATPIAIISHQNHIYLRVKSVICFGKAEFVEDLIQKRAILERMVQKYVPTGVPMDDQNIKMTAVVRIVVERMSGKAHGASPSHTVIINRFHPTKSTEGQQPPAK